MCACIYVSKIWTPLKSMKFKILTSKGPQFYPRHFSALENSVSLSDMLIAYFIYLDVIVFSYSKLHAV